MFTTLALLLTGPRLAAAPLDYSGLPTIQAATDYRIVTESVEGVVDPRTRGTGTVDYTSTTVYRNLGAVGAVTITIPRYRLGDGTPDFTVIATWDNVKLNLKPVVDGASLTATATFTAQGTHALRVSYENVLVKAGYGDTQRKTSYQLTGNHPVELFTMAYRYSTKTAFGEPTMEPDLDWQIGPKGISVRKQNFEPGGRAVILEFYPFGF